LMFVIVPTGPQPEHSRAVAIRAALTEALDEHLGKIVVGATALPPDLVAGAAAYNAMSTAVETGAVSPAWGVGIYGAYYAEARSSAAEWLDEVGAEFEPKQTAQLARASEHLRHQAECFARLPRLFPLQQSAALGDLAARTEASACLRAARAEQVLAMELIADALAATQP